MQFDCLSKRQRKQWNGRHMDRDVWDSAGRETRQVGRDVGMRWMRDEGSDYVPGRGSGDE